ncbi:tRNA splicing ligase [Halorubrum virus Serpecor1]|uniref:3'-phosphate/5'-hydroxy nucleic acid ligase n=1 Tax=Halorubrum virus Serpecor1 TaxID=2721757 RepID=A0A6G9RXY5_9CAUD|nr:tRNA splicing ligase [Halorubrum virus Serpecor1]QIR31210.1 RNA-splicing ligase RtcB [Halorubrum virus Serpecor1]
MIVEGNSTTAEVHLPEEEVEDGLRDEIQEMVDHEAFQNPVKFMPDCHGGLGPACIVGFSMPLTDRVIPKTVGGDIGCGMTAARLDVSTADHPSDIDDFREVNKEVRDRIPMGTGRAHKEPPVELEWSFPWWKVNEKLLYFYDAMDFDYENRDEGMFRPDYFEKMCKRVGISKRYALRSLGTLGSGNHFIEIAESELSGDLWVVVHSGSRNLGQKVAAYWQAKATEHRDADVKWGEMGERLKHYTNRDGSPDWEKIRLYNDGEEIERIGSEIESYSPDADRNKDLDYLEGREAYGYYYDMMLAQTYASFNRLLMIQEVAETLDASINKFLDSPHNYVDFEDMVIRKGSTRAQDGELFAIPMNMEDGTLLCQGRGNPDYNYSAPHGAGRLGSRGWAHEQFDADATRKRMYDNGTYSAVVPGDEVPEAYKPMELIEENLEPTARVVDRLKPVMNFKK